MTYMPKPDGSWHGVSRLSRSSSVEADGKGFKGILPHFRWLSINDSEPSLHYFPPRRTKDGRQNGVAFHDDRLMRKLLIVAAGRLIFRLP